MEDGERLHDIMLLNHNNSTLTIDETRVSETKVQCFRPFAPVIITMATGGCHLTMNANMGHNELLADLTYMVVFFARTIPQPHVSQMSGCPHTFGF